MADRNQWWLVVAASLTVFMAALDINIVAVALPGIEAEFGTASTATEWVALGYLLALIAFSLPSGRWLDLVGRRPAMLLLVTAFAVTSVLAGAAQTFWWLIAARFAQGAVAGALFALVPVVTAMAVRPEVRGRAFGLIGTVGPLGAVTGPALGGFLTDQWGWPWIFYVNAPVSLAVIVVVLLTMSPDRPLRWPGASWAAEAVLVGGASGAVLLALSLAPHYGWWWLALALFAVPLLAVWARRPTSRPVLALRHTRFLPGAHTVLLASTAGTMGAQYLMPYYLQDVVGIGLSAVGLTVLALPVAMAVTGPVAGALADRFGPRRVVLTGVAVQVAGLALILPLAAGWQPVDLGWRLAVVGVGAGLTASPVLTLAMRVAPRELMGTVGASTSLVRNLGFAVGPAVAIGAWAAAGYDLPGMRVGIAVVAAGALLGATTLLRRSRQGARPDAPADSGGDHGGRDQADRSGRTGELTHSPG